jgi:1-acyl-sn-glycerol-3-phosphate acyltransferase
MKAFMADLFAGVVLLFARAITAVRAIWDENGPPRRQSVYFANHASHGDFILIWAVLPPRLRRFIGQDVFNAVLIQRVREERDNDPIEMMAEALDEHASLIFFPEGTRNQTDLPLLPFKTGLFHLATARPDVDLVPVWIANLNRVMPKGEFVPVPLICTTTFGAPLRLQPGEDKEAFIERAQAALLALAPKVEGNSQ